MNYLLYSDNGYITSCLTSSRPYAGNELALAVSDELFSKVAAEPWRWKVSNGDLVLLTEEEASGGVVTPPDSWLQAQVNSERDRRIDAGVLFGGVLFQSRATDRENIAGAAQLAFMAIVGGAQQGDLKWADPDRQEEFSWIAADNSTVPMDAYTAVEFGKTAAARKSALIFAARQLKDASPIPEDFQADQWWPA